MALAQWSGRRIGTLWLIGGLLEAALLIVAPLFARRHAERNLPRIERQLAQMRDEQAQVESRWRLAEQADSMSVVAQRRAAIAAGDFAVSPEGDTIVALVRTPSGRPDSAAVAELSRRTGNLAIAIVLIFYATVPVALATLTCAWLFGRRRYKVLLAQADGS